MLPPKRLFSINAQVPDPRFSPNERLERIDERASGRDVRNHADDQSKLTDFYTTVFGWQVDPDSAGFNLVPFAPQTRALLGGLGQAQPSVPGYEKGITFYFEVEDLETKLDLVLQNGGNQVGDIHTLDGYTFVNFTDPEDNLIGMIKPFSS